MIFGHQPIAERPYPGCSYVARIDFDYGLHVFKRGQAFDLKAIGVTESQATDLWLAGRLEVVPQAVAPTRAPQQQPKRKGA